ncbi:MAG: Gfo/Idh/MocA family oxidoreductase [Planctomycetia bacterium]|nr:Gfo/Idh/MocA family oxidoreductase [Planctomycetia bacterium]
MSSISRRSFLGRSLALSALGASFVHTGAARSEEAASPNEKLGVMLVGCGGRGLASHTPEFLRNPHTDIIYVCDAQRDRAEAAAETIAEKQGGLKPKAIVDMREALSDSSLDIVTCATTNHWHALCGLWAMQAGKHAYIEKPICHNIHEGKALIAAAKKYDVMCQVGSQCRSNPALIKGFEFLRNGGIGEIKLTRGLCYKRRKSIGARGEYPVPKEVDYNFWSGPAEIVDPLTRPKLHYDWHWQRLYGNGDSGNQGPHQTDIARTALGVDSLPNSVITYGGRVGYKEERNDPNYVDAGDTANTEVSIFNFDGGKTLVFETRGLESVDYRGAKVGVVAYGSEGYWVQVHYGLTIAYDNTGKEIAKFEGGSDSYHFDNFVDAVRNHDYASLNADARCGHLSAALAHLGNISYYLGEDNPVSSDELAKKLADVPGNDDNADTLNRTLEHLKANKVDLARTPLTLGPMLAFDPKSEHFVDNEAAKLMETRPYRGEFVVPDAQDV